MGDSSFPFKNLAFEGGGVKGIAYFGALEILEEYGILPQIERVAGTSAGAVEAMLTSFRTSAKEATALFDTMDIAQAADQEVDQILSDKPSFLKKGFSRPVADIESLHRFNNKFGWYSSRYSYNWYQEIIAQQCAGNGLATFAEFRERGFRDLHVVATNLSTHNIEVFSADTTPFVAVAKAVRMSTAVPFVFEALRFDGQDFDAGDWYVDGGLFANYPIDVFDSPQFMDDTDLFKKGVNWESLGFRLYTPDDCPHHNRPITNVPTFALNLMDALMSVQKIRVMKIPAYAERSVSISNCCIQTTDFGVTPGSEKYNILMEAGRTATRQYLENYSAE